MHLVDARIYSLFHSKPASLLKMFTLNCLGRPFRHVGSLIGRLPPPELFGKQIFAILLSANL